jgi:hypothetical protein
MKRQIYFLALIIFITNFSFAQNTEDDSVPRSGTRIIMEEALKDPEKKQILDQLEIFTQEFIDNIDNHRMSGPYIIPLVIHVIHNYREENISYEQVDNVLTRLNEDFQGLNDDLSTVVDSFTNIIGFPNFEFRLATRDPEGNCTYGVNRVASPWADNSGTKVMSIANWDDKKYINIYVVRSFEESMSSAAAYAVKPGSGNSDFGDWNVNNDSGPTGSQYNRHVPTHEMGHFMNLDHPWGGNNDAAQEDNCAIDDGVEDTPPTIGTQGGCPLNQATCDGSLDNVQNFMEYSSCICMFTEGQANRMLAAVNSLAGNRWYLWQEENLAATGTDDATYNNNPYAECRPIPDFKTDTDLGCSGSQISFENYTYNYRTEDITYTWAFEGGTPSTSNETSPTNIQYDNPGTYDVSLTACNGDLCSETLMQDYITILSQTTVSAASGLSQGFESTNFPNTESEIWWVGSDHNEEHWARTNVVSSEGASSFKIKSQNYGYERRSHEFSTPELNLSEFTTSGSDPLMLCFDVAYAKRLPYTAVEQDENGLVTSSYSLHHDELIVSYKSCDAAQWVERPRLSTRPGIQGSFLSQQENLVTTDKVYFNSFVPSSDDWKQFCVTIQQLAGETNAIIKFEFVGTGEDQFSSHLVDADGILEYITASTIGGNWLYLDNILIGNSSVIQNQAASRNDNLDNLLVFPNPTSPDEGMLSFDTMEESDIRIMLTNFLGINIGVKDLQLPVGHHEFSMSELFNVSKKGSYIISIQSEDSHKSEIILIR